MTAIFSLHFLGGDGLVFLILTVAYSLDEQRVQLINEASDQPFVHPFRLTDGVSFSQGEALRQFLQQDASLAGAGQFGSAFVVAQLRQEQAAVFEASLDDGERSLEMLFGAILRVHPVALLAASGGGEDHAEAEGDQPVAFDDAEKLLVAEQVRFMQPFLETLVQPGPLRQRQAYLQRAPAKRLGDVHQLFGEFRQLLRHIHFVAFGRDILPDRLAAARIEQQAAQESALAVGDQAGELSRCPGEQQGEPWRVDADHLVVRLARRRDRFVMERLAEQVVKHPVVLFAGR